MKLEKEEYANIIRYTSLVAIDLIVKNTEGHILLGRRNNEPAKDFWFVPGGRIYKDEAIANALQRIVLSELGQKISIKNAKHLGVFEHFYETNYTGQDGFGTHYIVLAYELMINIKHNCLPKEQHRQYKWFSESDLIKHSNIHDYTKIYFKKQSFQDN